MKTIIIELENGSSEEYEVSKNWSRNHIDMIMNVKYGRTGWLGWKYK